MKRRKTLDRGPPGMEGVQIHATQQLSENLFRQPNGNLLCMNVPVARAGWLVYGPGEVPVQVGDRGVAYVERTIDSLFVDSIINSINGAPITNDHPPVDVTPANWKQYAGGFALNARRGQGHDSDMVVADLLLTDAALIEDVLAKKRELSWGYDADYQDLGGGIGKQFNMGTNHIALVLKGRCGPRCAIGDSEYQPPERKTMATPRVKIRGNRRTLDQTALDELQRNADAANAALAAASEDEDEGDQHIHVHVGDPAGGGRTLDAATEERIAAMEESQVVLHKTLDTVIAKLDALGATPNTPATPTNDGKSNLTLDSSDEDLADCDEDDEPTKAKKKELRDKKSIPAKTTDSAALETSYTELMSQAEILAPGFKAPTFDAALSRASTVDRMCSVRRKVLDHVGATADGATMLSGLNGGQPIDTVSMDCAATAILFKAAAGAKALLNNAAATRDAKTAPVQSAPAYKAPTLSEINQANAKFWEASLNSQ